MSNVISAMTAYAANVQVMLDMQANFNNTLLCILVILTTSLIDTIKFNYKFILLLDMYVRILSVRVIDFNV